MNTRLARSIAISMLSLIMALLGCAVTAVTKPANPPTATLGKGPLYQVPTVHEVEATTTLHNGVTGTATATCPQGEFALGGGWQILSKTAFVLAAKVTGNIWGVSVADPQAESTTVMAYVECLSGATGATVTRRETMITPTSADLVGTMIVRGACNPGEVRVGFGFDFGLSTDSFYVDLLGIESVTTPTDGWLFHLSFDALPPISTYVECLSHVTVAGLRPQGSAYTVPVSPTYPLATSSFSTSSGTESDALCPSGATPVGGGLTFSWHLSLHFRTGASIYLMHATATGWRAGAYPSTIPASSVPPTHPADTLTVIASAVCLSFS